MTGDGHQVMIEQHSDRYATVCACGWRGEEWDDLRRAEADAWRHEHGRQRLVVVRSPSGTAATPPRVALAQAAEVAGLIDLARSLAVGTSPMAAASQERLLDQADGVRSRLEEARSHIVGLLEDAAKANLGTADDEWLELQTARHLLDITLAGPAGGGPSARPRRGRPSTDAP